MKNEIGTIINEQFSDKDRELVTKELETISIEHVMAQSAENLKNTQVAILKLAKGDVNEIIRLVECAINDFRDVIYWASME
jgi:hypothetical protein